MIDDKIEILVVDDEEAIVGAIARVLNREGYLVETATNGETALEKVRKKSFDIVITDMVMPGLDGLELLKTIKSFSKEIEVIILTGHGSITTAVKAMKIGAFNYLTKPFDNLKLKMHIKNITEKKNLKKKIKLLTIQSNEPGPYYPDLIGFSPAMQTVYALIEKVVSSDCNLLITGKTGTGKEVVAKVIHRNSPRKKGPFVPVNCKAIPESLIESELFGHEKGAFTDAKESKEGFFESANGGILFLDEITEIPLGIQAKLLRSIQDKKIYRLGKTEPTDVDIRIIASTNRDIEEEIKKGNFREDLYFRLNVISVHLPPLRERASDIPCLAQHLLKALQHKMNKKIDRFDTQCFELFLKYGWPGNVRELENAIEHAATISSNNIITISDLPASITGVTIDKIYTTFSKNEIPLSFTEAREEFLKNFYIDYISKALNKTNGNVTQAAQVLKISRSYLNAFIKKYNITVIRKEEKE